MHLLHYESVLNISCVTPFVGSITVHNAGRCDTGHKII